MKSSSSETTFRGLAWPELTPGILLKRYKRFLADAKVFQPADHIDARYGRRLRRAADNGVEVVAYDVRLDLQGIELNKKIPCAL